MLEINPIQRFRSEISITWDRIVSSLSLYTYPQLKKLLSERTSLKVFFIKYLLTRIYSLIRENRDKCLLIHRASAVILALSIEKRAAETFRSAVDLSDEKSTRNHDSCRSRRSLIKGRNYSGQLSAVFTRWSGKWHISLFTRFQYFISVAIVSKFKR